MPDSLLRYRLRPAPFSASHVPAKHQGATEATREARACWRGEAAACNDCAMRLRLLFAICAGALVACSSLSENEEHACGDSRIADPVAGDVYYVNGTDIVRVPQ